MTTAKPVANFANLFDIRIPGYAYATLYDSGHFRPKFLAT
jgi:hypothetical protein